MNERRGVLRLVLAGCGEEGKKEATVAIGCSGGRHRAVTLVEALARRLSAPDGMGSFEGSGQWPIMIMHRELARLGLGSWQWARRPAEPASTEPVNPVS